MSPDREWWLRVPAVLLSPRSVFAALRSEEREDVEARSEPVLALTLLAGVAVALGTSTARVLYDDPLYDRLTLAIWIVLAGGFSAREAVERVGDRQQAHRRTTVRFVPGQAAQLGGGQVLADGECGHGEPPVPTLPCRHPLRPRANQIFGASV